MKQSYFGLDLVRFLAATAVMIYHLAFLEWQPLGEHALGPQFAAAFAPLAPVASTGWVGVPVFFALSGFVISLSASAKTPVQFLRGRVLRLYPGSWICSIVSIGLALLAGWAVSAQQVLGTVTLWPAGPWISGVYWTLGIEIVFYLLVAVAMMVLRDHAISSAATFLTLISVCYLSLRAIDLATGAHLRSILLQFETPQGNLFLLSPAAYFAVGMNLYASFIAPSRFRTAMLALSLIAGFGSVLGAARSYEVTPGLYSVTESRFAPPLLWGVAIACIWASVRWGAAVNAALAKRARTVRTLGLMTYPVYLLHAIVGVFVMVEFGLNPAAALAAGVAATLVLSFVVVRLERYPHAWLARALGGASGGRRPGDRALADSPEELAVATSGAVRELNQAITEASARRDADVAADRSVSARAQSAAAGDTDRAGPRKLLVLDASFTLEMIRERGLEHTVTCRDLGGFFEHVWSVHPFATMLASAEWAEPWGPPRRFDIAPPHTFIEGSVGRYRGLRRFFAGNFLIAQVGLFFGLRRLIRRERIDVIRAGDPHYLGLFGWFLARLTGAKLVVRVGANYDKIHAETGRPIQPRLLRHRRIEKWIERFVFRHADLIAGANQNNLDFAIANGAAPGRSTLFRYGNLVDSRHFIPPQDRPRAHPSAELSLPNGPFLLYVGRLVAEKYASDLVRVVCALRQAGKAVPLVCAGDGPLRAEMIRLADDLGVADLVVLAGNKSQGWLAQALAEATIVLSPHTGRALTEAALAAAAIVAYDVDWQSELIRTGETGILVPLGDWKGMADGALRLFDDPPFARRMGAAAREAALAICDPEALDEHERRQYAALFNRRPAARPLPS